MFIKKEDFSYLEGLHKGLSESQRKRLMDILLKEAGKRVGADISKIQVVGDEIFDVKGVEAKEFITRTMIKKAYKAAKED